MKKLLAIPAILLFLSAVPANRIEKVTPKKSIDKIQSINQELDSINILIKST
jgi:hypothetical protein